MKRIIKVITMVTMTFTVLSALAGCGLNLKSKELDYNKMIESFVESTLNTFDLTVGDEAAPDASIWLKNSNKDVTVYSSDENVVTVSEYGKVTAVGEGSAFVVITSMSLFKV